MINKNALNFKIIFRVAISLLPLLFGMPTIAMILCAYNIAMCILVAGPISGLIAGTGAIGLSMLFAPDDVSGGMYVGIEAVICGVICAVVFISRKSFFAGVWSVAAGYLIISFLQMRNMAFKAGQSVMDFMTKQPIEIMRGQMMTVLNSNLVKSDIVDTGSAEAIKKIPDMLESIMKSVIPSVFIIVSVVIAYIVMWVVNKSLKNSSISTNHSFSEIRLPKTASVFLIASYAAWVLFVKHPLAYVAANTAIILSVFGFFAGMSLADFWLRRKINNIAVRLVIYFALYMSTAAMAAMLPYANMAILFVLAGVVDSFVNFRKFLKKNEPDTGGEELEKQA